MSAQQQQLEATELAGLDKVASDVPAGHGYALAEALMDGSGLMGKLEVGDHITQNLSAFGFAQASTTGGAGAGVGIKLTF